MTDQDFPTDEQVEVAALAIFQLKLGVRVSHQIASKQVWTESWNEARAALEAAHNIGGTTQ